MKKIAVGAFGALMGMFWCAYGDATMGGAASRAWVTNYVANCSAELQGRVSSSASGGSYTLTVPANGGGVVSNVIEQATVGGLVVADASALAVQGGVTNGMLFAWNDVDSYVNGSRAILATATNLTYGAYSSRYIDSKTWLVDGDTNRFCRLMSTLIQPSVAADIIGGE